MSSSTLSRRLEGKVAIVTGGASGIGASTAELFFRHGAKVVIADILDDKGETLANKLGDDDVCYIHCDVSNEDQIKTLIESTIAKFGQLDIMHSNAGITPMDFLGSIVDAPKTELDQMLAVNLIGGFLAAKHAARAMINAKKKKGCIIFTASACTEVAGIASHAYVASKYGLVGLTKSLATELGVHGIRVNCVSPFGVLTGDHARNEGTRVLFEKLLGEIGNLKGKVLEVEDIAKAALYLASDDASYVSGMNLVVDGGYSVVNPSLSMAFQGHMTKV